MHDTHLSMGEERKKKCRSCSIFHYLNRYADKEEEEKERKGQDPYKYTNLMALAEKSGIPIGCVTTPHVAI